MLTREVGGITLLSVVLVHIMVLSDAGRASFDAHIGLNGSERALDTFGATGVAFPCVP